MTTSFEKKCQLLERLWYYTKKDSRYDMIRNQHDITFPVLSWLNKGHVAPVGDMVEKNVDYLWEKWLKMVEVEDTGDFEIVFDIDPLLDHTQPVKDYYDVIGGEPADNDYDE